MTCGTMKFFGHKNDFYFKYWFSLFIMIVNDGSKLWHMAQWKNCHMVY